MDVLREIISPFLSVPLHLDTLAGNPANLVLRFWFAVSQNQLCTGIGTCLWFFGRIQGRHVNELFHSHFFAYSRQPSGTFHVDVIKFVILRFPVSSNQVDNHIRVLHC